MAKRLHRLVGMSAYTCGAMDRVPDGGIEWRRLLTPELNGRGVIVYNPADKPLRTCQDETSREERLEWIRRGDYHLIRKFMREVRGQDLRMVNRCDFMIVRVDPDVHMCGSYEEMAIGNHEKKPILVWTVGGKDRTPWWLFGQLPHEMIFGSREELLAYLDHVDTAKRVKTFRRWFFFDQRKLYTPEVIARLAGV